ncbi:MAG: tetratricopeptide repeat protein [Rhodospirillaceae bacterium]|nr:tetratricopeptide repeat protein [Rhodospirillaceae bacterium]
MDSIEQEIILGKVEIQEGKFEEASLRFKQLLGTHPNNAEVIHGLAVIATQTNDLENAVALANKAAQLYAAEQYWSTEAVA